MGKTKVPKLVAVSMPFNGMQTASYCNNTLQRTANVTSHRCNNSCDVQVYHELLQGQTYCMPMSHSLTRCRLTSGPTPECEDLSFPKRHAFAEVQWDSKHAS